MPEQSGTPRAVTPRAWRVTVIVMALGGILLGVAWVDAQRDLATLATQVRSAGAVPQASPALPLPARDGQDGRGVLGTAITAAGHLVITYSDGTTQDAGLVVGTDGAPGEPGVGVASTAIEAGRLVLVLTDGRREDVGRVVGPAGIGVARLDGSTGRLLVTLSDGEVVDAGPLPPGPRGEPGPACPAGYSTVEVGPVTSADGTEYSRAVQCVDPASAGGAPEGRPSSLMSIGEPS